MQDQLDQLLSKWAKTFALLSNPYVPLEPGTYTVKFNPRMRSRAGVCSPSEALVLINPHLAQDYKVLEEILVHELCHLVIARRWPHAQSHGQKWKNLMRHLGFAPKRCHDLVVTKRFAQRRWDAFCPCKTHKVSTVLYNRLKRGTKYQCLKCKKHLSLTAFQEDRGSTLPLFSWLRGGSGPKTGGTTL